MKNIFRFGLLALAGLVAGGLVYGLAHTFGGTLHPGMSALGGAGGLLLLGAAMDAPAAVLPKNSKDVEGIRGFFSGLKQQFASTATIYEGPIRQLFEEVVSKLDTVLASLPKTTDANWSLNDQLESLFHLLNCANNCTSSVSLELQKTKQQMASLGPETITAKVAAGELIPKADFEKQLAAAVAKRTAEGGDLVPKDTVTQLCSAAKDLGLKEGREAAAQEVAAEKAATELAGTRRAALTTAGLPLPEAEVEAILRAAEPDYAAAKATAESRLAALTTAGIELGAELRAKVWLPEAAYGVFQKTVSAIPALKRSTTQPEPLAGGLPGHADKRMVM